ncbi:hypothetical protein HMPREF0501_00441 [Limosilactobacillus coleohominis 101-4-CHN]|uniref:Uncharacterized protein n=1 Tax=Limosilactobacillus coleohominis 101-4-CHN TaxID=575594 RepID=C7XUS5_9LACO|nr:hypothetical protein [Limosilactobacillus coleohominis]EEU31036.1 hypothetical protein HMPREF0501_00441 [Limosilactobacillus coleohominis 101-4-CHN]
MTEEMIRPMTLIDYEDPESHVPVKACSPDNGRTVKIYFTPWGIVWHADDVEVLWNDFLKDKVKSAMSVDWDSIQNKPKFVTPDELEARLNKLSMPTVKWADIEDKPVIPSTDGLVSKSELSGYAKLSQIPKMPDLSGYATTAMLVDYVKRTELPDFTQFAKRSDIPSIANLVNKAELDNYAKKEDLPDFSQFATKADLSSSSGVKQSDLDKVRATAESALSNAKKAQSTADANSSKFDYYVTTETLDSFEGAVSDLLSNKADRNELPSIDTSDLHTTKKPSDYSDGFSYEVKALSDLGIDLTKYDKSVQNGWIGLVKSERVSIFNTVYVTQTVRVLGSYRPSTFIRNGSNDTWYPFELLNTWS